MAQAQAFSFHTQLSKMQELFYTATPFYLIQTFIRTFHLGLCIVGLRLPFLDQGNKKQNYFMVSQWPT